MIWRSAIRGIAGLDISGPASLFKTRTGRLLIMAVMVLLAVNVPLLHRFTISDGKTDRIVLVLKQEEAQEFYISFIHSVNKTPVNEYYRIQGNKFKVEKTTFYSYGAGMPEYDPAGEEKIRINDGIVEIENLNREMEEFIVIVGAYAQHSLHYGNRSINLSKYVAPQNPAVFRIQAISLSAWLFQGMKDYPGGLDR